MLQPLEYAGSSDSGLIADKRDKGKRSPHYYRDRENRPWPKNRLLITCLRIGSAPFGKGTHFRMGFRSGDLGHPATVDSLLRTPYAHLQRCSRNRRGSHFPKVPPRRPPETCSCPVRRD